MFAFSIVLLLASVGLAVSMMVIVATDVGADAEEGVVIAFVMTATSSLLAWYLVATRRQVFAPVESQVRQAMPLARLRGTFDVRTIRMDEAADREVLTIGGLDIAVPEHWPPLPDRGTALAFLPLIEAEAPAWRRQQAPMVVEVVGWRSLDDDLRNGTLASDGLRFRTRPRRR